MGTETFSLTRMANALVTGSWKKAGFELEQIEAEAARLNTAPFVEGKRATVVFPMNVPLARSALNVGTATLGGNLVFGEQGTFIDLLRPKSVCLGAGATFLNPTYAPFETPRIDSDATLYWIGDARGADLTWSNPLLGKVSLPCYEATSGILISQQFVLQSGPSGDELVASDIAKIHSAGLDLVALRGTGTMQPTGLLNTSGLGSVAMGTNGAVPTLAKLAEVERVQASANADVGSLAWVTTPVAREKMRQTQDFTDGRPLWDRDQRVLGYPAFVSTNIPSNLTKGTSTTICSAAIFGNWADLLFVQAGAFEITVDRYTLAAQGLIRLVSYQLVDVGIRHPESFTVVKDLLT